MLGMQTLCTRRLGLCVSFHHPKQTLDLYSMIYCMPNTCIFCCLARTVRKKLHSSTNLRKKLSLHWLRPRQRLLPKARPKPSQNPRPRPSLLPSLSRSWPSPIHAVSPSMGTMASHQLRGHLAVWDAEGTSKVVPNASSHPLMVWDFQAGSNGANGNRPGRHRGDATLLWYALTKPFVQRVAKRFAKGFTKVLGCVAMTLLHGTKRQLMCAQSFFAHTQF